MLVASFCSTTTLALISSWRRLRPHTEHGARVSRCRLQRSDAEGRKAQGGRSVETADESVTGSVFLFPEAFGRKDGRAVGRVAARVSWAALRLPARLVAWVRAVAQ